MDSEPTTADLYFFTQSSDEGPEWAWALFKDGKVVAVLTVGRGAQTANDGTECSARAVVHLLCRHPGKGRVTPTLIERARNYLNSTHGLNLYRSGLASPDGFHALNEVLEVDPIAVHNTRLHAEKLWLGKEITEKPDVRIMDEAEQMWLQISVKKQLEEAQNLYDKKLFNIIDSDVALPPKK